MVKTEIPTRSGKVEIKLSDDYFQHLPDEQIAHETGLDMNTIQKLRTQYDEKIKKRGKPKPKSPRVKLTDIHIVLMFIVILFYLAHIFSTDINMEEATYMGFGWESTTRATYATTTTLPVTTTTLLDDDRPNTTLA